MPRQLVAPRWWLSTEEKSQQQRQRNLPEPTLLWSWLSPLGVLCGEDFFLSTFPFPLSHFAVSQLGGTMMFSPLAEIVTRFRTAMWCWWY